MYDPTLKTLIDFTSPDWARWLQRKRGLPEGPYSVEPQNLTTAADADRVFRFEAPYPHLLNLEVEAQWRPKRPERFLKYSVIASDKADLPVSTLVLLLCKEAFSNDLTGTFARESPDGEYLNFQYRVVKVWELPPEEYLDGGIGLLPLAPLSAAVQAADLPAIVRRMEERLRDQPPQVAENLLNRSATLMGLRFPIELIGNIFGGVTRMENSSVYQYFVKIGEDRGKDQGIDIGTVKGTLTANRLSVSELGSDRFGEPNETQRNAIEQIADPERLRRMIRQVLHTTSWEELLRVV